MPRSKYEMAKNDLEFMVIDSYCPVEMFWNNVGDEVEYVENRLYDIAQIEDEKEYKKALRKLMNEYI